MKKAMKKVHQEEWPILYVWKIQDEGIILIQKNPRHENIFVLIDKESIPDFLKVLKNRKDLFQKSTDNTFTEIDKTVFNQSSPEYPCLIENAVGSDFFFITGGEYGQITPYRLLVSVYTIPALIRTINTLFYGE